MNATNMKLPMVELFQTIEGEGTRAGFPTTFVRVYNCNLRCAWCDTTYSYAPHPAEFYATVEEIAERVASFGNPYVCLTGGEPLMHGEKSLALVEALASIPCVTDVHIETNGAVPLEPFAALRDSHPEAAAKVRFIMDWKLPSSREMDRMLPGNLALLDERDECKFVIGDEHDFEVACQVLDTYRPRALPLFSPVWETMPPARLAELLLASGRKQVKLNLQIHKVIWHPDARGV
ncbi:radical SAM protein [Brevibacillus sp. SYP-B805]|uniref:7-carboxy-7-deazaguanine synthase QueE n=1 Tax=Brevibacillus sp. SYP-B805 TaxID=1578199 RepID=UPI0013EDEB17|nr:radical SAM protein [Brevibacillus sp. SYP-B805]NGQ96847.1 radical SAM protein [Brevibacillus sp. SYP-B805]